MKKTKTVALVACSKKKQHTNVPIPVVDLYNSSLFRKSMACAKSLRPDAVYILSAKYHLVEPYDKLPYYDMYLPKQSVVYRRQWADKILKQLENKGIDLKKDKIVFLTGRAYYINLIKQIEQYQIIGEGLRQGEKMREFGRIAKLNNNKND